jgi:DNA-binding IclR family transcriptional regulator
VARPSPQTERLVDVLEVLADTGTAGRSLAELSRHLGVDKATCLPMLQELTRVGWLFRHPRRKTFHLGPRLVAIGKAAETAIDTVDLAREALHDLAETSGAPCLVIAHSGAELTVAAVITPKGHAQRRALGLRAGDRIALRPPLGAVLVAWSPPDVERWLNRRFSDPSDQTQRNRYAETLELVRQRGYAVEEFPPAPLSLGELLEALVGSEYGSRRANHLVEDQISRLRDDVLIGPLTREEYWPISINSPVFDRDGRATLAMCVVDLRGPVSTSRVAELGDAVARLARSVTLDAHGQPGD